MFADNADTGIAPDFSRLEGCSSTLDADTLTVVADCATKDLDKGIRCYAQPDIVVGRDLHVLEYGGTTEYSDIRNTWRAGDGKATELDAVRTIDHDSATTQVSELEVARRMIIREVLRGVDFVRAYGGLRSGAHQRDKLERLCRYIARPAVASERLSLTCRGEIRCALKTPYRDGTTHVIFEPLDFIARLAALVPRRRVNLTRFHAVFAPNSRWRAQITPARRGKRGGNAENRPEPEKHLARHKARRLKRVFQIDIDKSAGQPICTVADCREAVGHRVVPDETCERCGGAVKNIASIRVQGCTR